jgi:hypothetical protein
LTQGEEKKNNNGTQAAKPSWDFNVFIIKDGKVLTMKQSEVREYGPCTVYGSSWEAEQVAKYGPKWYLNKERK